MNTDEQRNTTDDGASEEHVPLLTVEENHDAEPNGMSNLNQSCCQDYGATKDEDKNWSETNF